MKSNNGSNSDDESDSIENSTSNENQNSSLSESSNLDFNNNIQASTVKRDSNSLINLNSVNLKNLADNLNNKNSEYFRKMFFKILQAKLDRETTFKEIEVL
jgi:hypothetical protein